MGVTVPSRQELENIINDALRKRAGITNFSESSIAGTLSSVVASFISDLYSEQADMEMRKSLSTAYGVYLDAIGEFYGVYRLPAKSSTTVGSGRSVLFTNPTSTNIVVPEHTRIWAKDNYNIAYYTAADVTVPAAGIDGVAGKEYVDVSAASPGDQYNVESSTLTQHNAGSQLLMVTNVRAISNGSNTETDDNYRYRIKNALLARNGNNTTTLRMRLLELPGVRDVIITPLARGTGTVDVVVVPVDRYTTDALLQDVQTAAESAVAPGISVKVNAPVERPVDITIQVSMRQTADKSTIKSLVSSAVRGYIDNLPLGGDEMGGGDIILSEIIASAMNAASDVLDVNIAEMKIDDRSVTMVNQKILSGERFYLQSIKVV